MNVDRRSFLRGALSVAASSLIIPSAGLAAQSLPAIYGDGIHCDADGIEALSDGRSVDVIGDGFRIIQGVHPMLLNGRFLFRRPITISNFHIERSHLFFKFDAPYGQRPALTILSSSLMNSRVTA